MKKKMLVNSRWQWSRKRVYYAILLYFIGLLAALMVFQVSEPAQRDRWVFSVFAIGFGVLLVLHALDQRKSHGPATTFATGNAGPDAAGS